MSRQSNEIMELAEEHRERIPATGKVIDQQRRAHCEKLGVDPDAISDAMRQLLKGYARGPIGVLMDVINDPGASKSAKAAAAQAILPYLHGKPQPVKAAAPKGQASGVMEVPIAASMEQWVGVASASQAELKRVVRE